MDYMQNIIGTFAILLGLVIGSFLNVVIYRVPQKLTVVKGSSFCPGCRHNLEWIDMIPVFSFLFLGGKCRYCKEPISFRYPFIELLNALCYLLVYLVYGLEFVTIFYAVAASCLIALAMIDFDTKEIPDRFNIAILACGIGAAFLQEGGVSLSSRLVGLFCISVPLFGLSLLTNGIGEGDIKLFAACGFLLGWRLTLLTLLFSSVCAAIFGIALMIAKKAEGKTELAFGPFIAFSAMVSLLVGDKIIEWYMNWIMSLVQ